MKKISLSLLVTILGSFAACDDEDSPKRSEVMSAQCQDESLRGFEEGDSLTYTVEGNTIGIAIRNLQRPCDLTKFQYLLEQKEGNRIVLTIEELDGGAVNCICPMNFDYSVGNLTSGETYYYEVRVKAYSTQTEFTPYTFSFICTEKATGTVYQE